MKSTKNKRTKKQHYIAQGIIKTFFDSEKIYEKNVHNEKIYGASVNNTMCMNDSYEIPLFEDNFLEDLFAISIDENSSILLNELKTLLNDNKFLEAKVKIFKCIRIFLIDYYKSVTSLIHMSKDISKKDDNSIIRMVNTIFNMPYIDRISELLLTGYDFSIIKSNNGNFILSDQFISTCSTKFMGKFINMSNREIGLKNTIVLIPISKDYYGVFINGKLPVDFEINLNDINELTEKQTEIINNIIYNNSYEKCISLNEKEISQVYKEKTPFGDSMALVSFGSGKKASFKTKQEVYFTKDEYDMYKYFESYKWADAKFKNCGVNSLCPCGSKKKYKKCCRNKVEECKRILNKMQNQQDELFINKKLGIEEPVQLTNYETLELQKEFEILNKQTSD